MGKQEYTWPPNNEIATEPIPDQGISVSTGVFVRPDKENVLVPLRVVYPNPSSGDWKLVYITKQDAISNWAGRVYQIDDQRFILVPMSAIKMVKSEYTSEW